MFNMIFTAKKEFYNLSGTVEIKTFNRNYAGVLIIKSIREGVFRH